MMRWLTLTMVLCASAAGAESPSPPGKPMTAEEFDAATRGLRMDTFSGSQLYGVEEFLPGQRSIWRDGNGCKRGTWAQVGDQICFAYEDDPAHPDCWLYVQKTDGIHGWFEGDTALPPIRLQAGDSPMICDFLGV